MTRNERVAKALGIEYEVVDYGGGVTKLRDPTFHTPLLDYEHDIKAAMTLVPAKGVVSFVRMSGVWAVTRGYATGRGLPLSAAIVDAFLKSQGASDV